MMQKDYYCQQFKDDDPVIFMEHKRLVYDQECDVPENMDPIPLGKGKN